MMFPTLSGLVAEPINALTIAEGDTVTPQQFVDGVAGGAIMGYVGGVYRTRRVVANSLGNAAEATVKENLIMGLV